MDAYKPFNNEDLDRKRKEDQTVLLLNSNPGESNTDADPGKLFLETDHHEGETSTEDDPANMVALYDPKWERSTVQLEHNPYSKESIVQRKFSKMQFQLTQPTLTDSVERDSSQGGPKRLNVGPKDINKNFNYDNIKKNFVINRDQPGEDREEYEDFAFRWNDRSKSKISSSSSMESTSVEEEEGEQEAFECMQVASRLSNMTSLSKWKGLR